MRLRVKTLTIIGATFICLVTALYFILSSYQMSDYLALENEEIRRDINLLQNVIQNDFNTLDTSLRDWAAWDDTRDYVLGKKPGYLEQNLVESTFTNFKLNMIIIMNNERKYIYARAFDLEKKDYTALPKIFDGVLPASHPFFNLPGPKCSVKGILVLPEGTLVFVSQPVVNSNDDGPICGTMIMAKWLDDEVVTYLRQLTNLQLSVFRMDDSQMPDDIRRASQTLSLKKREYINPIDEQSIAGYCLLEDVYGKPALIVKVLQQPRPIYARGESSIYHQMLSLLVVGLVFGFVTLFLLETFVVRRLFRLNRDLTAIGASGNSAGRVLVSGQDELAYVSKEINSMLAAIELTQKKDLLLKNYAMDNSIYAIAFADSSGMLTYINPAFVRLFGYDSEKEIVGRYVTEFSAHPELTASQLQQVLHEGSLFGETRIRRKDESQAPVQLFASLIRNDDGTPLCVMASFVDLTKQHQAKEALRASEERFRLLSESMPVGIYEIDEQGHCLYTNNYWQEIFGVPLREFSEFKNIIHVADRAEIEKALTDCLFKRQDFFREFRVVDKDGKTRWAHFHGSVVKAQNYSHYIGSLIDITQRREAEEEARTRLQLLIQADKLIALGTLVSGVAHEINNPINFMELSANVLQTTWGAVIHILDEYLERNKDFQVEGIPYSQLRQTIPTMLKNIVDGTERIKNIVVDLKSYARQEPMTFSGDIQINDVVKGAITLTNTKIKKATKNFEVVYGENLPHITGSSQRLEQVVVNLLLNACESLTDENQRISVRTSYDPQSKSIGVVLRDEGVGIPQENHSKILDPFFTTKRERGGVGLGLAVSASIVKEHGGQLQFDSPENHGTTVTLTLPVNGGQL